MFLGHGTLKTQHAPLARLEAVHTLLYARLCGTAVLLTINLDGADHYVHLNRHIRL